MNELKDKIPKETLELLYVVQNKTLKEVADIYDCSPSGIKKLMTRYDIKARSPFDTGKPLKEIISKEEIFELYVNQKKTPQELAKLYNCSDTSIRNLLKHYDIDSIPTKLRDEKNLYNSLSKEELHEMYYTKGFSANEIGNLFNVSHTTVLSLMDEYGFFRPRRKSRTVETAIKDLTDFYNVNGKFNTSILQKGDSGLEKYLRDNQGGLREFCNTHNMSNILLEPKRQLWNEQKAIDTIIKIYKQHKKPVGFNLLNQLNFNGLYQWITRNYDSYKDFCVKNDLQEYTNGQIGWNDAKCFRLIKNMYIENEGPINPEIIKTKEKGAHQYIYETHASMDNFILKYDLQDYVVVNNQRYDDDIVTRLFKEAYYKKGSLVNPKWLVDNGYNGIYKYLTTLGEGEFLKGCSELGLQDYSEIKYTEWNEELAKEKVLEMYNEKQQPIISIDFEKFKLTGLRSWITNQFGSLKSFFEMNDMLDKYENMAYVGKELWSYGKKFELLVKEVVELLFEDVIYDHWIEYLHIRPDFVIGDTGLWIDAKLSSFAYFTDETAEKYTKHAACKELWLVHLRGHKFKVDNPKVKVIDIHDWYDKLRRNGREDLTQKIDKLYLEVEQIETPR